MDKYKLITLSKLEHNSFYLQNMEYKHNKLLLNKTWTTNTTTMVK